MREEVAAPTLALFCCIVNGLNNFQVGFLTAAPALGAAIDSSSYELCGSVQDFAVSAGVVIEMACAATTAQYQYVVVQSTDSAAEKLCVAEICVYEGGQPSVLSCF